MKTVYVSTSKHPLWSAERMMYAGATFLWRRYDSGECREWEITNDKDKVTLETNYEGTIQEDIGECQREDLENFWSKRGFRFVRLS